MSYLEFAHLHPTAAGFAVITICVTLVTLAAIFNEVKK